MRYPGTVGIIAGRPWQWDGAVQLACDTGRGTAAPASRQQGQTTGMVVSRCTGLTQSSVRGVMPQCIPTSHPARSGQGDTSTHKLLPQRVAGGNAEAGAARGHVSHCPSSPLPSEGNHWAPEQVLGSRRLGVAEDRGPEGHRLLSQQPTPA